MTGLLLLNTPNAASAQQRRVVVIERVPVFDPFFPYPYPYPPGYDATASFNYPQVEHR